MPKTYFLPASEAGRRKWLKNFSGKLPTYAPTVGVTPAEVAQETADDVFFNYVRDTHWAHTQTTRDWTAYKHQAAHGDNLGDLPVTPAPGTPSARSGNTRPSTGSITSKSASGATWPPSA